MCCKPVDWVVRGGVLLEEGCRRGASVKRWQQAQLIEPAQQRAHALYRLYSAACQAAGRCPPCRLHVENSPFDPAKSCRYTNRAATALTDRLSTSNSSGSWQSSSSHSALYSLPPLRAASPVCSTPVLVPVM